MCKIRRVLLVSALWAGFSLAAAQQPPPVPAESAAKIPDGASVPSWPAVTPLNPESSWPSVRSGDLELRHSPQALKGFAIRVTGQTVAIGVAPSLFGYVVGDSVRWVNCSETPVRNERVAMEQGEIRVSFECADPDGGTWRVSRGFRPAHVGGAIDVQTEITVDQDRSVAFLPMLFVFPGVGSFGASKGQGLFAGLEYLENEPSSSEADVIGPAAKRQVPDNLKITFPLMAIQNDGRYLGLVWQMRPQFSAVFDSPDRLFNSAGHVMGLLFPGSNGPDRQEGNLLPRTTQALRVGQTMTLRATLLGGAGSSLVPAVQQFVQLRPLPPAPGTSNLQSYVSLAAGGWLDSRIRTNNLIRHAIAGGSFNPQPAADAALWMQWLATHSTDAGRAAELTQTASNVLSVVPPENRNFAGVGHIRYPVEALVFGDVARNAEHALEAGKALLANFESDGSVKYRPAPNGPDFAKTHSSNEASGLASRAVADLLELAAFSGDSGLLETALHHLRALDKFRNGVPRGAQTWECPLHTPDILAAANMVRAYDLGYELSQDPHFLEQARYWAWTGVPFVYLVNPTDKPVGLYATIAVFGATQWKAPVWLGLPVQWCGLVYAEALYRLSRHDPKGPWKQIADGITASGIQQSWPQSDPDLQGLLPDSFVLRAQKRNGPAINPATVEACAVNFFGKTATYDFHYFLGNRLGVHAPGEVLEPKESQGRATFRINSWVNQPYYVLINGVNQKPKLRINGESVECSTPHEFSQQAGRLILQLVGHPRVELEL